MRVIHAACAAVSVLACAATARAELGDPEPAVVAGANPFPGIRHTIAPRSPDRTLVISANRDEIADFVITIEGDLSLDFEHPPRCGSLLLGSIEDAELDRVLAITVTPASPHMPLDDSADVGERRGEMIVMLDPPDPDYIGGLMNVDFECTGDVDVVYPVWVLVPRRVPAAESAAAVSLEGDMELSPVDASEAAGCSAAPRRGGPTGGLAAALVAGALWAERRRRSRQLSAVSLGVRKPSAQR